MGDAPGEAAGELASDRGVRAKIGDCDALDSAAFGECRIGEPVG